MTITNEQAAYIAGLFDGEGSIYFAKRPEKKKKHKGDGYRTPCEEEDVFSGDYKSYYTPAGKHPVEVMKLEEETNGRSS